MIYIDANVVLRYLLNDNKKYSVISKDIIENNEIFIKTEVLAEIVYVLNKTYNVPKDLLKNVLIDLLNNSNINVEAKDIIIESLNIFNEKNIDFIDSLLCAYGKILNYKIATFDKKLIKCLKEDSYE